MKKIIVALAAVLFCVQTFGQGISLQSLIKNPVDTTYYTAGWANLNYAVPESPAFSILGTSPDNIIKPTSARSVALSVGNYFLTSGNVIPKNLSVEISPLLLKGASLFDYNKNKFLYRIRLSLGTSTNSSGSYNLAEGLRFTAFDKTDLRANGIYLKRLGEYAENYQNYFDKAKGMYAKSQGKKIIDIQMILDGDVKDTTPTYHSIDSIVSVLLQAKMGIIPNYITNLRDSIKKKLWNAAIMEFGGAALQSSTDSLIKDIKNTSKIDGWWSWGIPVTNSGQLLLGFKYQTFQDTTKTWRSNIYTGMRFYYGVNEFKGYLQAQFQWLNKTPSEYVGLGCEFSLVNGLWADLQFDVSIDQRGKASMKPALNIRFGTPEKKKT